jgi:uncharacterized membrane protein
MAKKPESRGGLAMSLIDGALAIASSSINRKLEELEFEAAKKAGEIKHEVVASAYEAKRGIMRTMVEALLLSTGILALVAGILLMLRSFGVPFYQVLLAYGFVMTMYALLKMKTAP